MNSQAMRFMAIERCCEPTWQMPAVPAHRIDQGPAFGDADGEGLFGVDILAGLAGLDAWQHAAVVGRADDHRVEILLVQSLR